MKTLRGELPQSSSAAAAAHSAHSSAQHTGSHTLYHHTRTHSVSHSPRPQHGRTGQHISHLEWILVQSGSCHRFARQEIPFFVCHHHRPAQTSLTPPCAAPPQLQRSSADTMFSLPDRSLGLITSELLFCVITATLVSSQEMWRSRSYKWTSYRQQ